MKKSYIFYAFVVIFALSVYYFDYHKGEENKKNKDAASILIPFSKDQITKIELQKNGEEVLLLKDDKNWKLSKPLEDLADENVVSDWLNTLTSEKNSESLGDGEVVNWANYGLDKPKAKLTVFKANGEKVLIEVSSRKNFEGSSFLRKDLGQLVLVASASWQTLIDKSGKDLRDKRIFRNSMSEVETVEIKRAKNSLVLQSKEGIWFIKDKVSLGLSQNSVREVVNGVSEMRAQEFSLEGDPNVKQKNEYGLSSPLLNLELKFKNGKNWNADFGQSKDKTWYVWAKDLHKVIKLENSHIDKINKVSIDSLRDREAPFIFKKDDIKKVSIQIAKDLSKSMELSKDGNTWKSSLAGQVDEKELTGLFDRLAEIRVGEFLDNVDSKISSKKLDVKGVGIEPPQQRIVLADAEGKLIWSIMIGDNYKRKVEKTENQYFYVKTNSYNDVVGVGESSIKNLHLDKIMKPIEPPKK